MLDYSKLFASQVDLVALNLWGWFENALNWMAGFVIGFSLLVVSTILFPGVSTIIVGFFLEDVVIAVEAKHYPNKPPARAQPVSEVVASTAKFALAVVGLNLVCLPIYLILMFVPPLNLVLYYLLNGYLISREYFELVSSSCLELQLLPKFSRTFSIEFTNNFNLSERFAKLRSLRQKKKS